MLTEIKKNMFEAKKNRDTLKANLLSTLYSEAAMVGKNNGNRDSTTEEVVAIVKKFVKNTEETVSFLKEKGMDASKELTELDILNQYTPKQLTKDEIHDLLSKAVLDGKNNIGLLMGFMKEHYAGKYDGKLVSEIAKSLLN